MSAVRPTPAAPDARPWAAMAAFVEGVDYQRTACPGVGRLAVMAPHGGGIEPGSGELAAAVAAAGAPDAWPYYVLAGLRAHGNADLHRPSTLYDDPLALDLAAAVDTVVTLHGWRGAHVLVGGRHAELRQALVTALLRHDIPAREVCRGPLAGIDRRNLCNRGRSGRGIQLELGEDLRRSLFLSLDAAGRLQPRPRFWQVAGWLREALAPWR
jgi:phage replication-related protein YjqB (UPF0714/DUF867 family)